MFLRLQIIGDVAQCVVGSPRHAVRVVSCLPKYAESGVMPLSDPLAWKLRVRLALLTSEPGRHMRHAFAAAARGRLVTSTVIYFASQI
jgi:hypothetical protein